MESDLCKELPQRNKMKILLKTGNIHYDYQNANDSIYDFFQARKGHTKKPLNINLKRQIITVIILQSI